MSIQNSVSYIRNRFFFLNNKTIFCGYSFLTEGDLLNVNYKYFKVILFELKGKSSFVFVPFYDTFLTYRKPFIRKQYNLRNSYKTKIKFKLKFLKVLFFNHLVRMFYTINHRKIYKFKINFYYKIFIKFLNIFNLRVVLFHSVSKFNDTFLSKISQKIFRAIHLIKFVKQYIFILMAKKSLFKLIYFYLFKFSYFIDKYSFLIPHYLCVNYNNLELLVILRPEQIRFNKSNYIF